MKEFIIDNQHSLFYDNNEWTLYTNGVAQIGFPRHFYKYYALNSNNIDALKNGYFYLNNPKNFNDPFDCCRNLIIEKQKKSVDGLPSELINDIKDLGITCFSTDGLNPLMWGHYVNSYCGFVLKFKQELEIVRTSEMLTEKLTSVIYSNNPNPASEKNIFSEDYQSIVKLKHWEYENEWRLIVKKRDHNLNKVYFSKKSIEEIMIGFNTYHNFNNPDVKREYDNLMEVINENYPNVKLFIVGPHEKEFKLTKIPLRFASLDDIPNMRIVLK